jgi:DNA-binding LytR/AlgR family response regulator
MNCIIIDDEALARQGMELLLKNISYINIKGNFRNAVEASNFLQAETVDLIFLDIDMPGLNGIDFVKTMLYKPLIIFVTAYPQFALDSYEVNAVDYLVKPLRFERLLQAIHKAESYLKMLNSQTEKSSIESISDDFVFIKADKKFLKVFFTDILYIEGLKDYVIIKLVDGKIIALITMKAIAAQLPTKIFIRINKSYIININNISAVDNNYVYISDEEIPIGDSYRNDFINNNVITKLLARE